MSIYLSISLSLWSVFTFIAVRFFAFSAFTFSALMLLVWWQEGHPHTHTHAHTRLTALRKGVQLVKN